MTNPAQLVLHWGDVTPDAPAIVSTELTMTYAELADSVRRMAARLRKDGIRPGSVVAIRARPELEALLLLAVLHEGAVSLHGSEAVMRAYADEIDFLLGDRPRSIRVAARTIDVGAEFMVSLGSVNARVEAAELGDSDPCRIVFSSGTTGSPKGVEFTVASLLARTASARTNWMPRDPFMCLLGLDTVSGFQTFAWTVMNGRAYFVPGDGPANLALLRQHGIRSIKTSPARLENLVDAAEAEGVAPGDLAVEVVQVAGSLLTPSVARLCKSTLGCTPLYLYGSTEVGTVTRGIFDPSAPNAVGTVVDGSEVQVVDEVGQPAPAGDLGAIRYRAAFTPDHYWRAGPDANNSFRDGWFYPGDLGVLDADGRLLISGRADDLVNAGGAKFNLAELDLWMRELDLFTDCASFQFRDAAGATSIGIAFQSRHSVDPAIVLERVRGLLPNLEIRALLRVDGIPRNHLGKVVRTSLAELINGDKQ